MSAIPIGSLSRKTGVKVTTIRYYESVGLLPAPDRSASNRRVYEPAAVERLRFIRHARELGFEVAAIRQLLTLSEEPERPCGDVDRIARVHIDVVTEKIGQLEALRDELQRMVDGCRHRRISDCRVLNVLGDHSKCVHDHH